MREGLDFSSLLGLLTTLLGIVLVSVVAVSIRMLFMQTIQRKRERENRQINERLRTLIAAYKTLGGSFTGELSVDPTHLRDLLQAAPATPADGQAQGNGEISLDTIINTSSERKRRVRDVVDVQGEVQLEWVLAQAAAWRLPMAGEALLIRLVWKMALLTRPIND